MRWADGSLQFLIGNEVLDMSVQDAQHDQAHLFLGMDRYHHAFITSDQELCLFRYFLLVCLFVYYLQQLGQCSFVVKSCFLSPAPWE